MGLQEDLLKWITTAKAGVQNLHADSLAVPEALRRNAGKGSSDFLRLCQP